MHHHFQHLKGIYPAFLRSVELAKSGEYGANETIVFAVYACSDSLELCGLLGGRAVLGGA